MLKTHSMLDVWDSELVPVSEKTLKHEPTMNTLYLQEHVETGSAVLLINTCICLLVSITSTVCLLRKHRH